MYASDVDPVQRNLHIPLLAIPRPSRYRGSWTDQHRCHGRSVPIFRIFVFNHPPCQPLGIFFEVDRGPIHWDSAFPE